MTEGLSARTPTPSYEVGDNLVKYNGEKVIIQGRFYYPANGGWLYDVQVIKTGDQYCNVPEKSIVDMQCPVTAKIECKERSCELHYMDAPIQFAPDVPSIKIDGVDYYAPPF